MSSEVKAKLNIFQCLHFSKLLLLWAILWKGLVRAKRQCIVERGTIHFPFLKNKRVKTIMQARKKKNIYHWSQLANFIKAFLAA